MKLLGQLMVYTYTHMYKLTNVVCYENYDVSKACNICNICVYIQDLYDSTYQDSFLCVQVKLVATTCSMI